MYFKLYIFKISIYISSNSRFTHTNFMPRQNACTQKKRPEAAF